MHTKLCINTKLLGQQETEELFSIVDYNDPLESVVIAKATDSSNLKKVSVTNIEMIEFKSFYNYKGQAAKILRIN